ncbi:MAG: enoyl-CoA hydratase/isomerase family protein [Reyranellaceae bacterium]
MADYANLRLRRDGPVAHLTLHRPERRNALTHQMMLELEDVFTRLRSETDCRVVVLRGAGGNFCAGGDLAAMAEVPPLPRDGSDDPLLPAYRQFGNALLALNGLPQATIAVVEGAAVGGGLGMACCSDIVLLHADAALGMPEPKVGFIPSQIIPFVVRRIGEGAARDLAVSGRVIRGHEAHRLGVGRPAFADTEALERALAETIADVLKMEPRALAAAKHLVMTCAERDDEAVLDAAAASLVGLLRSDEAAHGIQSFMSKSLPRWARS